MGVLLRHCNSVRPAEQKSLRIVGDTKSNPVCAVPGGGKVKCKQQIRQAPVLQFRLIPREQ